MMNNDILEYNLFFLPPPPQQLLFLYQHRRRHQHVQHHYRCHRPHIGLLLMLGGYHE